MKLTDRQLDQLHAIISARIFPTKNRIYRGSLVCYIRPKDMGRMIDAWSRTGSQPYGLYLAHEDDGTWTACEGETGECLAENYHYEKYALRWLVNDSDNDTSDSIHLLDRTAYFKAHGFDYKALKARYDYAVYHGEPLPEDPSEMERRLMADDLREGSE